MSLQLYASPRWTTQRLVGSTGAVPSIDCPRRPASSVVARRRTGCHDANASLTAQVLGRPTRLLHGFAELAAGFPCSPAQPNPSTRNLRPKVEFVPECVENLGRDGLPPRSRQHCARFDLLALDVCSDERRTREMAGFLPRPTIRTARWNSASQRGLRPGLRNTIHTLCDFITYPFRRMSHWSPVPAGCIDTTGVWGFGWSYQRLILQFGNACLNSLTPSSVIWVLLRRSCRRLVSSFRCSRPASVTWVSRLTSSDVIPKGVF